MGKYIIQSGEFTTSSHVSVYTMYYYGGVLFRPVIHFRIFSQELLRLNPRPLASCQWTTTVANDDGGTTVGGKGVGLMAAAGSGLARARAIVKPSAATVVDRHHYTRNSSYSEVCTRQNLYTIEPLNLKLFLK